MRGASSHSSGGAVAVAERRRQRSSTLRAEITSGLRARAERYFETGGHVYPRLGEMTVQRAERIERGVEPVTVHGWELPDGVPEPDGNPSHQYTLYPDDRLIACPGLPVPTP